MLKLFEYGAASVGRDFLNSRIKEAVENKKRSFLIAPEQETVAKEGEMASLLPPSSVLYFEVTNFTRFCDTVFREIGGLGESTVDKATRALLMWRTLSELSPLIRMTSSHASIDTGLVSRALGALNAIKALGITPKMLEEALKDYDDNKRLKDKASDLALISALYEKLLLEKYSDANTDLARLCERLKAKREYLADAHFFIDGFTSFTEAQYSLIALLIERAEVTVTLDLPRLERGNLEYLEIEKTKRRLVNIANRLGKEVKIARPDGRDMSHSRLVTECASLLFAETGEIDNECLQNEVDAIRIFEANTPFDECDFVASDIKRRVCEGAKYSDFAVIARSTERYAGILASAFKRNEIPLFVSDKRDSTSFEAVKLILTLYAISVSNYSTEDVITYAKCSMSGLSKEECDRFELYVNKWKIKGSLFACDEDWNMNPDGYEPLSEDAALKIRSINEARRKLLTPVIDFTSRVKDCRTVREHSKLLWRFLTDIKLEDALKKKCEELLSVGEYGEAKENERLYETIISSLDTLVSVMGDTAVNEATYLNLLETVLSEVKIGKIPQHVDEVVFLDALLSRSRSKKHVYLLGVNQGEFPAKVSDNEYFSEREKATLSSLGLSFEPDLDVRSAKELYSFKRSFLLGKKSVTLLYSRRSTAFAALLPSDVIGRIKAISKNKIAPVDISTLPLKDKIYTPESALYMLGDASDGEYGEIKDALASVGKDDVLMISEGSATNEALNLTDDSLGLVYKGDLYLSQTRIDTFLKCPMNYFCSYTLGLDKGERAEINYAVIGTFVHSILENFFLHLKKNGIRVESLSKEERESLAQLSSRKFIKEVLTDSRAAAREDVTIRRLSKAAMPVIDSLCEEFSNCRFTPVFFELNLKSKSELSPGPAVFDTRDGGKVLLGGAVDRTDTYQDGEDVYVRVVDYKTGSKEFSPSDIAEGKNLQMFLYLKSITESKDEKFLEAIGKKDGGSLIPAGVIYVKTGISDTLIDTPSDTLAGEAISREQKRVGMLLDDDASLSAMNKDFSPVSFEADGSVSKKSRKFLYSKAEWQDMLSTISDVISDVSIRMKSGEACTTKEKKQGMSSPCSYCSYKPICRSSS